MKIGKLKLNGTNGNYYTKINNDFVKDRNMALCRKGLLILMQSNQQDIKFPAKSYGSKSKKRVVK